jgi:hypothetical protein
MLSADDLKNVHLCIATPCYGGAVFQNYLMSMLNLNSEAHRLGLKISYIIRGGDSLIPRTRNSITAEFLATEKYTHLLWIDADIGFGTDQIFRLLMVDRDVVGGVYPLKKIVWPDVIPRDMTRQEFEAEYTHYPFNPVGGRAQIDAQGFMEVLDAPTGMMLIKRSVLEKMKEAYPGLRYLADEMLGLEHIKDKLESNHYRFFDVMTEESGRYLSEDYAFCRRWQNIGGKIFVDSRSKLSHQGGHIYTGDFKASMLALDARSRAELEKGANGE